MFLRQFIKQSHCLRSIRVGLLKNQTKYLISNRNRFQHAQIFKNLQNLACFRMSSSQQQNDDDQELMKFIRHQKMKLQMDMEFLTSTIVEERCYNLYPIIIESGSSQDCFELGQIMHNYVQKMEQKQEDQQKIIQSVNLKTIKCYGHIIVAFGHLKNDNNELADQELSKMQAEFQSFESKIQYHQKFLIVCHIVSILSLAEKEEKCLFLVRYIFNQLQSAFKDLDLLDEGQYEIAFKSIHFYILSLIQKKKDDMLKQIIEESQFLNIEYLYNNSVPIAFSSAGHIFSCIGFYFQQNGDKLTAYRYLKFSADIFEQIEGKDSENFKYIKSQIDSFK
ncbi:hypothetical protein TTHERM_00822020 (macronuclear) [Tetrahymena thermophila SB210]|uniref:Uncharacterized protein n=1 Tax=Tetrahymena thermophila (strain SB210) TaxID=312017 RepID=Q22F11_TETTS|nr:hypothetical protein TTHERM_00822020 [Tetrahymena thermophila SB210]EAR83864.2 hypothetical protein TTHERM_00822020 [Tetrahymena thermophila SB210]|eukprot:XP_001031527.2 hypothetical protein TTHERM_00822020 [Tetrahymena thermophila SB210]